MEELPYINEDTNHSAQSDTIENHPTSPQIETKKWLYDNNQDITNTLEMDNVRNSNYCFID